MKSSGTACNFVLLTMVAVSSGRNAAEYFQQARFQYSPSRPYDAFVLFTATAPPLICEPEMEGNWIGGDSLETDLILETPSARSYYTCSFEGNATTDTNLKLIQKSLPDVFTSTGQRRIEFSFRGMYCITDSKLPGEYFDLRIQRPNEEHPVKCIRGVAGALYLRFPRYPTIICKTFGRVDPFYRFNLPGIVGDRMACAFQVYIDLPTSNKDTEKLLYESLVSTLPFRLDGRLPDFVCSLQTGPYGTAHFQVRFPGSSTYACNFSDT